mgnify:CR=1 FL=1
MIKKFKTNLKKKEVVEYLILNPEFLVDNPEVLSSLRVDHDSGAAVSLIQKQVEILRKNYNSTSNNLLNFLEEAKNNENIFSLTKRLTLDLINTSSIEEVISITEKAFKEDFQTTDCKFIFFKEKNKALPKGRVKDPDKSKHILGDLIKENKTYRGALHQDQSNFIFNKKQKVVDAILTPLSCSYIKGYLALGSDKIGKFDESKDSLFLDFITEVASILIDKHLE